jgi:hypothetical protein
MMHKLGTLSPLVYFVNHDDAQKPRGWITIAPYTGCPTPRGHTVEYADTLQAIDRLQKTLQEQELRLAEQELAADDKLYEAVSKRVVDRLEARMVNSATSAYEREFIRLYLQLRYEKRDRHRQRFLERSAYLWARENEVGSHRRDDEEVFHPDRINVS